MFLTAISVALAGEYSYEYTGTSASSTRSTRADCYFVETPVTVTSIAAYVKKSTGASSSSFDIVVWREEGVDDWVAVNWISASQSDTSGYNFIEKSVSWRLVAGESYCLGHTGSNMLGFGIDEDVADPVFGYMRGSADATGGGDLVDVPTRSATIDTKLRRRQRSATPGT